MGDDSDNAQPRDDLRFDGEWEAFLGRLGAGLEAPYAPTARNFLLQEGVPRKRRERYRPVAQDHGTLEAWIRAHDAYLREEIFQPTDDGGPRSILDPSDIDACPETFRYPPVESPFHRTDGTLALVRVEVVDAIAGFSGEPPERVREVAEEVTRLPSGPAAAELNQILDRWSTKLEVRPTFAGYWAEVADLFEDPEGGAPADWADRLRDRLGLAHLDPGERGAGVEILVFSYPASEVPRLTGTAEETRPLLPPSVLDFRFSAAFVPAPRGIATGHVVHLAGNAEEPRCEVVHPTFQLKAKHLVRAGVIRRPVDWDLLPMARAWHLLQMRDKAARPDYAAETDGDILS